MYDDALSRFHLMPERNGQTDGQICYINIARQYADARQKWCILYKQEKWICVLIELSSNNYVCAVHFRYGCNSLSSPQTAKHSVNSLFQIS